MLRGMIQLPVRSYIREVLLNLLFVIATAIILPVVNLTIYSDTFLYFVGSCFVCVLSAALSVYVMGCSHGERIYIREKATQFVARFKHS